MYEPILHALRGNAHAEAIAAARELLASSPDDAQLHRLLAIAHRGNGDADMALESIDRALALEPEHATLHLERAGLLIGARRIADAQNALGEATGLNPNQFDAYLMQARLALGQGDLDAAERHVRLAARVAPDHPGVAAVEGMLALRRGDGASALAILSAAAQSSPGDTQLRYASGMAYMEQGHLASAEQAFRGVLEAVPSAAGLRGLLAQVMARQGHPGEGAAELAPLFEQDASDTPGLRLIAGELELQANRPERALPHLKKALASCAGDQQTLTALMQAWRLLDDIEDARSTLEAALATTTGWHELWLARLYVAGDDHAQALNVAERWNAAMPGHVPSLEARLSLLQAAGEQAAADAVAREIVQLEPGRVSGEAHLVDSLLQTDPDAALERIEALLPQVADLGARRTLQGWLALVQDRAGRFEAAATTLAALRAEEAPERLPLPPVGLPATQLPALGSAGEDVPPAWLLWGPPGSGVERIAAVLASGHGGLCADRFGPTPPDDAFQNYGTVPGLDAGTLEPATMVEQWRQGLAGRGYPGGNIVDWLLWWDNALLLALRPHLPEATLLVALRDPRDMLLDWLAHGGAAPLALTSPMQAATWLAAVLDQVATLHEQGLYPHRLVRLDEAMADVPAVALALAGVIELAHPLPASFGAARFATGHWRQYAGALAEPFAMLRPVSTRLGYPES